MSEPTPEQRLVIGSEDEHLFVAAAAGSGKTRVLVERYLRLVQSGLRPDQILTITYTRKAAAEMKRRIVGRLRNEGRDEDAQVAETGPIQTVHSFCERTLRENSVAAGLDPEFQIVDPNETASIIAGAIADALTLGFDDEAEDPLVIGLVEALAGKRASFRTGQEMDSPHEVLLRSVHEVIEKIRGTRWRVEDLEAMASDTVALYGRWLAQLMSDLPPVVKEHMPPDGKLVERLEKGFKAAKVARPNWVKQFDEDEMEAARHTVALLRLAARAWRKLESEMQRRNKLDFTLLERLAVNLVANDPEVGARLSKQYPAIFVDEAQDLNPMQYRLLTALASGRRMLVGDAQQSIYGFRLADVDLFRNHPIEAKIKPLPLSRNFRSLPGILSFVDSVFAQVWGEGYRAMSVVSGTLDLDVTPIQIFDGIELWPQDQRDTAEVARHIQSLVQELEVQGRPAKDICVLVRKSTYAVDLLRRLERLGVRARISGGTERYYTRMEVRDVANALRALTNPHDDFSLLATLRSPFVGLSFDAIALLAHKESGSVYRRIEGGEVALPEADAEALAHFLKWFKPLAAYADRLSAWEAIAELYAASPYLETLARRSNYAQLLANARKLLALATASPEVGPAEFAENVRETQRLRHREGEAPVDDEDADGVLIMTIHKAKGLEFPVVVVPETHLPTARKARGWLAVDARIPMVVTRFPGGGSLFFEYLAARDAARDADEEWRVLYVALTRAQTQLCVVIDPRKRGETFAGLIAKHIGFQPDRPPIGAFVREGGGA